MATLPGLHMPNIPGSLGLLPWGDTPIIYEWNEPKFKLKTSSDIDLFEFSGDKYAAAKTLLEKEQHQAPYRKYNQKLYTGQFVYHYDAGKLIKIGSLKESEDRQDLLDIIKIANDMIRLSIFL